MARLVEWSERDYHDDRSRVSRSALEDALKSIELYHARWVLRAIPGIKPNDAMRFGNVVHPWWLENDDTTFAIRPDVDRRTKQGKEIWSAFVAENEGRLHITQADYDLAKGVVLALRERGPDISADTAKTEATIIWEDDESGLPMRARLDWVDPEQRKIVDLKTTGYGPHSREDVPASPAAFSRKALNFGYHRQCVIYTEAACALWGGSLADWRYQLVVVSCKPPHQVVTYEFSPDVRQIAAVEVAEARDKIARAIETGDWADDYEEEVQTIQAPGWMLRWHNEDS